MRTANVDKSEAFDKCCKKCGASELVVDSFAGFLYGFGFNITSRTERPYITPKGTAQLWDIQLGNPNKGKGMKGGYRTLAYYTQENETFYMDFISEKAELTKTHNKKAYQQRIKDLKDYLRENYQ